MEERVAGKVSGCEEAGFGVCALLANLVKNGCETHNYKRSQPSGGLESSVLHPVGPPLPERSARSGGRLDRSRTLEAELAR